MDRSRFINMYAQHITRKKHKTKNNTTNLGKDDYEYFEDPGMVNDFVQCHVK